MVYPMFCATPDENKMTSVAATRHENIDSIVNSWGATSVC